MTRRYTILNNQIRMDMSRRYGRIQMVVKLEVGLIEDILSSTTKSECV
jgi:hypothetical protein